jgi:hypothetical protein
MAATLTTGGRASLVQRILGSTFSIPKYIAWGTGAGTAVPSDEGLFDEVVADGRIAGTTAEITTSTSGDTYQVQGTITSTIGETITNVGLFDTATEPYQSTLQASVTSPTQTGITVITPGTGTIPSTPFNIQVLTEVMTITNINGNAWTVVRGINGSQALSSIPATTLVTSISGNLFAKANFTGIQLSAEDSIHFTINVQFS